MRRKHRLEGASLIGQLHRLVDQITAAVSVFPTKMERAPFFLSMVVPTYNVELYIERFLASIFGQSSPMKSFEVIIVDDGSTDRTAEIVRKWEAWFPDHIRYVYQENAGAAAARNTGMDLARGTWITFPDPDDFLDVNYFREMLKELKARHRRPLLAVVSNFIMYYEDIDKFIDRHPLRFRFTKGTVRKNTNDMGKHIVANMNSVWFNRGAIERHKLRVDTRTVPAFEDGNFTNRLLTMEKNSTVSFVPAAKYYYRKRGAKTSILDTARDRKESYLDQIEYGYLPLFNYAKSKRGYVPYFVQRTVFYSLFWKIKYLENHAERLDFLTKEERDRCMALMGRVIEAVDEKVIARFNLAGIREEHKVGLLALYKDARRDRSNVYVMQYDERTGLVQFRYYTGGEDHFTPRILVNGKEVSPQFSSRTQSNLVGRVFYRSHYFWVPMAPDDYISFVMNGKRCRIKRGGKRIGRTASLERLQAALRPAGPQHADEETLRLRAYVRAMRGTYGGCKVLMDRVDKADDNAEHLYRYMMATGRADNAYFVLSSDSADWKRLEAEGFCLLPYGSDDHIAAQFNSAFVLSSHFDNSILWPAAASGFGDIANYQLVFLQHGVKLHDQSGWFNSKNPRLIVATTYAEAADIAGQDRGYKFSEREVALTGMPRHDSLWRKGQHADSKSILITPTWRKYLTIQPNQDTPWLHEKAEGFLDTQFARNWLAFLTSPKLKQLADQHGLRVDFAPHPKFAFYLDEIMLPDYINKIDVRSAMSYQDLFARARVGITDYSSAVFDIAYLQRPVLYFQFDHDEAFSGGHTYKPGYFSYQRDGFGPVAETADELIANLEAVLSGREDPVYAERRDSTFPFRDGGCCERVCQEIEKI